MTADHTIIDAWMQHPTPGFIMHPMFESLRRWLGGAIPTEIPAEFTLATMDQAGVSRGLICAWYGPQGAMISNEDVAAVVNAHPDRFTGIASVNLYKPMEGVRELRRCVKELGFRGLRMLPWLWNLPPNDRRYYPLYAECVQLGVPVCFQVGHTGPMCPSEPGRPIPYIDEVALDFPELTIVGGHIGYPWTVEMIALATKYPNVYIDTSAYKTTRYPAELVEYMKRHGREKVLFGSNFPMLTAAAALEKLDELGLDDEVKRLFLCDNTRRVFGLE